MVARQIRTLRERAGLATGDLARRLGVSADVVRGWEEGGLPETEHLAALAALFGVTADYLLGIGRETLDLSGLRAYLESFSPRHFCIFLRLFGLSSLPGVSQAVSSVPKMHQKSAKSAGTKRS